MTPDPADQSQPTPPASSPIAGQPGLRVGLVFVIVVAIVGTAWLIGERQGFGEIGKGGVNAELLPKVGEQAPDLVTYDTQGRLVRLSAFRGQPVWLNFWGSWCPPCRAEFPDLQAAWEDLQPQGLVMLGIAVGEDPMVAQDYANRVGGTFPVLADPSYLAAMLPEGEYEEARKLVTSYTINNYPTHIFIDREGIVRHVILAQVNYDKAMEYGQDIIGAPAATPAS